MRHRLIIAALTLSFATSLNGQAPSAPAANPSAALYSTEDTDIRALIAEPQAEAILVKRVPERVKRPQIEMVRSMPLRAVEQYAAHIATAAKLAVIDEELAKLPPKSSQGQFA